MIMAGASVDDVFVIVLFTAFAGLAQSGNITPAHFLKTIVIDLGRDPVTGRQYRMYRSSVTRSRLSKKRLGWLRRFKYLAPLWANLS
jgi:hypothetical protein